MKQRALISQITAILAILVLAVTHQVLADTLIYRGAGADQNWSTGNNWSNATTTTTGPAPGATDDVIFQDDPVGSSTVDTDFTIQSLLFTNTSASHNVTINSGLTLDIAGGGGGDLMHVGTLDYLTVTSTVDVVFAGAGTLMLNNTNEPLVVRQGFADSGDHMATLDLSGLDSFNATASRMLVGVGDTSYRRSVGTMLLAKTNVLTLLSGDTTDGDLDDPALMVGDNQGNNNGNGSVSYLTLGQENTINADTVRIGGQKQQGNMSFSETLTDPTLVMRGSDGVSRIFEFGIGDESQQGSSGNPTTGTVDLSAGTADILAETMFIGKSQTSNGREANGNLTLGAGTLDVNTLELAYETTDSNERQAGNRTAEGQLTINGTTVVVNDLLRLGREGGAEPTQIASLTLNGGSLSASNVVIETTNASLTMTASATLTVTNPQVTLGTLTTPLENFNIDDSTLNLSASGGKIVASTFTPGGSGNTINVTSVPQITQYPAEIPLIRYTTYAGFSDFTLGSLPAASPAYAGYLSNDFTGAIWLVMTDGPLTVTLDWDGTVNGDWDTVTANWLKTGASSVYNAGDPVSFDDNASGTTTVNLTTTLSPSSIEVNNSSLPYTFTGLGRISGSTGIDKQGSGTLAIENEGNNDFAGDITIGGGTLRVGDGGTNGNIPQVSIANDGNFTFNRSDDFTLPTGVSGSGAVTKMGLGSLTLAGGVTYTGGTMIDEGKLVFDGDVTSGTPISVAAGAEFATLNASPVGQLLSTITSSGRFDPGDEGIPVYLEVSALTLNAGGTLKFDFTDDIASTYPNDYLQVDGNLTLNNNTIEVGFQGIPTTGLPYTIISYFGTKSGSFSPAVLGTHYTATVDESTLGVVNVTFTGSGANMKWASTNSSIWSGTASNWLNAANSILEPFYAGDTALLDDSVPNVVTDLVIPDGARMAPLGFTNNSSINNYTISGGGAIGGSSGITKSGTSTLTLATANDFDGPVEVMGGTIKAGTSTALGTTTSGTTIQSGATLDVNGQQLNAEVVTAAGPGVGGGGAIVNTGSDQVNAIGTLVLTGDTTFGGTGRWDIRGGGASLSTGGLGYNLTKVGSNMVAVVGANVDAALGDVDVQEGVFAIQTSTVQNSGGFGNPANTITIHTNAMLNFWNLNNGGYNPLNKIIDLKDGGGLWSDNGSTELTGPVTTEGEAIILTDGGTTLSISNVVSGAGGLTKTGGGTLTLYGVNTYAGDTLVTDGTVGLSENGSISSSSRIIVDGTLDVSSRTDGTLTLASGQTLGGSGNVNGTVIAGASSTVAPGTSIGTLNVSGDVTLGGSTVMEVDAAGEPNSDTLAAANITYGGTLVVTNIGGDIIGSHTFQLFTGNLGGSFATVTLPNIPGVTWDTSDLEADGTITAIGPNQITIDDIQISGTDIILSGSGGTASGGFTVLSTTNAALPVADWEVFAAGNFGGSGNFSITNTVDPDVPQQYFLLQAP